MERSPQRFSPSTKSGRNNRCLTNLDADCKPQGEESVFSEAGFSHCRDPADHQMEAD